MTTEQKQNRTFNTMMNGLGLPKVTVEQIDGKNVFMLRHANVFVPDIKAEWDAGKEHYRIYIFVAGSNYDKKNAGYCICTVGSGMDAANFITFYAFLCKRRANNKEASFAS